MLEPKSSEALQRFIQPRHDVMRRVAKASGTPLLDMQSFFDAQARRDQGILWWDGVHMTAYGQQLAAEFIAAGILEHFDLRVPARY